MTKQFNYDVWQKNIVATIFDDLVVAYKNPKGWYHRPGVALPFRFKGPRPKVELYNPRTKKRVIADIIDVGPWNINDPYWLTNSRPQAESRIDMRGRKTNRAGIDLNSAAADAIKLNGLEKINWRFVR